MPGACREEALDTRDVQFRLLGPFGVHVGGRVVHVGSPKHRALLAALLLRARRPVPVADLAEAIWSGERQPANPRRAVQLYIARLRGLLANPDVITSLWDGYQVNVRPEQTDLGRFHCLLDTAGKAAADGSLDEEAAALARALAEWHGEPLAGVPSELLQREAAPRLAEQRIQALERWFDLELRRGRPAGVIDELLALTARHPLRERLWAQLMTALDGIGRRSEALGSYHTVRLNLAEELGVDPGAQLRAAHAAVLAGDAANTHPVPRQLPADVPAFSGRAAELHWLDEHAAAQRRSGGKWHANWPPMLAVLITGMGGIGKTALAAHWAHRAADQFPDGQLWLNLRGFDASEALAPEHALRRFLRALGVRDTEMPLDTDEAASLFRSLTDGRRMLIVLDNAASAEQVRPLLPGSPGSLALVTSRSQLSGLVVTAGACPLRLDLPSADDARRMLSARLAADRSGAEPAAAERIIGLCARLPLALALVAARSSGHPGLGLTAIADELQAACGSLDAFTGLDRSVELRTVFAWSYQALSAPAARLFRLLSHHPGPHVSATAAASLAGQPPAGTRMSLAELADAHMLAETAPGRYAFHDLLRAYATELTVAHDPEPERQAARHQMTRHYLHTAYAAVREMHPYPDPGVPRHVPVDPGAVVAAFGGPRQALDWLGAEHLALRAVIGQAAADHPALAWQLTWPLADYLMRQGLWHEAVTTLRSALRTSPPGKAQASDEAGAHRGLARAYLRLGRFDVAEVHCDLAFRVAVDSGDQDGTALAHRTYCKLREAQGRHTDALDHDLRALRIFEATGNRSGRARALNAVGWMHALLGDFREGIRCCQEALALLAELGDTLGQAATWDSLGYARHHLGQSEAALTAYQHALDLYREHGDRYEEAATLVRMGDAHDAGGGPRAARAAWLRALAILTELGHRARADIEARLARLPVAPHGDHVACIDEGEPVRVD